ncbi:MAG: hypothetical protein A3F13_09550 [Gammaproteobacteria bacterium RIFCSPHIGHO2_12_FULL_40_19]|nr:MAG: hypothetical protein A3F13_09550 [Gammaproteobacteria bacterium RIFCSPHIGHO2_12_FULL_40_19]
MPLNPSQEVEINFVIDPFFENFPLSENELILEVEELIRALKDKIDQTHRFYWLRECLIKSTHYFRLEKLAAYSITIGEVQTYILDRINYHLQSLANKANVPYLALPWHHANMIFDVIPQHHFTQIFTSKPAPYDGLSTLPLPADMGFIYSYTIISLPNDESDSANSQQSNQIQYTAYVQVKADCGDEHIYEETIELENVPYLNNDREEDQFTLRIESTARAKAEKFAANVAMNYLPHSNCKSELIRSRSARQIITYRYYFNSLVNNEIAPIELSNLSVYAGDILTDSVIVELIKMGICDFNSAKELTRSQKAIVIHPVYSSLLTQNLISMADIIDLENDRCKFLLQTPIAGLIQRKKLNFYQAITVPIYLEKILTNSLYLNFFAKENINWAEFCNIKDYQYPLLLENKFSSLCLNKQIDFKKINRLTDLAVFILEEYPHLVDWLEHKFFTLNELNYLDSNSFFDLHLRVYATRLHAIYCSTPYTINNQEDNVATLLDELPNVAIDCGIDINQVQQRFFQQLISIIRIDLATINRKLPLYDEILHKINHAEKAMQVDWRTLFNNIIKFVNDAHCQTNANRPISFLTKKQTQTSKYSFFYQKRQKIEKISLSKQEKKFCETLLKLANVTVNTQPISTAKSMSI